MLVTPEQSGRWNFLELMFKTYSWSCSAVDVLPLEDGTWGVVESIETRFSGAFRGTMTIRKERGVNEAAAD